MKWHETPFIFHKYNFIYIRRNRYSTSPNWEALVMDEYSNSKQSNWSLTCIEDQFWWHTLLSSSSFISSCSITGEEMSTTLQDESIRHRHQFCFNINIHRSIHIIPWTTYWTLVATRHYHDHLYISDKVSLITVISSHHYSTMDDDWGHIISIDMQINLPSKLDTRFCLSDDMLL